MLQWSQSSLLLVGHGSTRYPDSAADLLRLAGLLRHRRLFERVDVAFWRQDPLLSRDQLRGRQVFVLPYFAGAGKHTEELIPERLGLAGRVTERDGGQVFYCAPIGCHPALPSLIERRAMALCQTHGLDTAGTALLLIAHGSSHGGASRTPHAIAAELCNRKRFAEVATVFLEQAPYARDWADLVTAPAVVAQPLLLAAGMHASEDLPSLFGGDRPRVFLQSGVGSDDEIIDMMLGQIEAAS
jgi:sirohydrochlorin cobaltochelatase